MPWTRHDAAALNVFMAAIRRLESGSYAGNYAARGPLVTRGTYAGERAHGAYQIMPGNWSSWARSAGLSANAPKTKANQDRVAQHMFRQYYSQYGSWEAVAIAWFAGPRAAYNYKRTGNITGASDGHTSTPNYVKLIQGYMANAPANYRYGQPINVSGDSGPSSYLQRGDSSSDVRALQRRLKSAGYDPGRIDGNFGPRTEAALRAFQRDHGYDVNGRVGTTLAGILGIKTPAIRAAESRQSSDPADDKLLSQARLASPGSTPSGNLPSAPGGTGGTSTTGTALGGGTVAPGGIPQVGSGGPVSTENLRTFIQTVYPQMLWAIDHKELGPILQKAASQGWDQARLYGALIQTQWWKTNPESARVLKNIQENDPATWKQMTNQRARDIITTARQYGWNLSVDQARTLAREALAQSWTEAQTVNELLARMPLSVDAIERGEIGGQAAENYRTLQEISSAFLINVPKGQVQDWIRRVLSGERSMESFRQYAEKMALSSMPWLAPIIEQGLSPLEGLANHRAQIGDVLELSADQVDLRQDKYQTLLTVNDGKQRRLATQVEVRKNVRDLLPNDWSKTGNAKQLATTMIQQLGNTFGTRA